MFIRVSLLIMVCMQVWLPDVEFFVNLGDWPLEKRKPTDKIHPIFSWCGSNNTQDIVMPTYDLTESVLETMGRYKNSVKNNNIMNSGTSSFQHLCAFSESAWT